MTLDATVRKTDEDYMKTRKRTTASRINTTKNAKNIGIGQVKRVHQIGFTKIGKHKTTDMHRRSMLTSQPLVRVCNLVF